MEALSYWYTVLHAKECIELHDECMRFRLWQHDVFPDAPDYDPFAWISDKNCCDGFRTMLQLRLEPDIDVAVGYFDFG